MPRKTGAALAPAAVSLVAAFALMFTAVPTSFDGQRLDCGDSVWRFFPVDPGNPEDLPRYDACDAATIPRASSAMGLAAGAVVLVTLGSLLWNRVGTVRPPRPTEATHFE